MGVDWGFRALPLAFAASREHGTLTYARDIDAGDRLDQLRHLVDDLQHLLGELGGADFTAAGRDHRDLLRLREWGGHFGGDLQASWIGGRIIFWIIEN